MISFKLQFILLIATIFLFAFLIKRLREYKLELKYSLLWIIICFLSVIVAISPQILSVFSEIIGIETPVNTLFLFAITATLVIQYSFTLNISKLASRTKELSQELGILKNEVKNLKLERLNNEDDH